MPPPLPQPVLAPLTPAAIFLVATIDEDGEATVHDALPKLSGLVRAVGFRDPAKRLSVIASIGSNARGRLFSGPRPAELNPFIELKGSRHHHAPSPGDLLLFHIRAEAMGHQAGATAELGRDHIAVPLAGDYCGRADHPSGHSCASCRAPAIPLNIPHAIKAGPHGCRSLLISPTQRRILNSTTTTTTPPAMRAAAGSCPGVPSRDLIVGINAACHPAMHAVACALSADDPHHADSAGSPCPTTV